MKAHCKLDVAKAQLDRAIILYFEGDYYSATTLAGASDEIFGQFLENKGFQSELKSQIRTTQAAGEILFKERYTEKHLASVINEVRNWLKHFTGGKDLVFDAKVAAIDLIDRACKNYFELTGEETNGMRRFMSSQINLNNAVVSSELPNP